MKKKNSFGLVHADQMKLAHFLLFVIKGTSLYNLLLVEYKHVQTPIYAKFLKFSFKSVVSKVSKLVKFWRQKSLLGAWLSNSNYNSNQRTMPFLYEYKIKIEGQSKPRSLTAENVYPALLSLANVSNNYVCTVAKNDLAKGNVNKRLIPVKKTHLYRMVTHFRYILQ